MMRASLLLLSCLMFAGALPAADWVSLFDGKTLDAG